MDKFLSRAGLKQKTQSFPGQLHQPLRKGLHGQNGGQVVKSVHRGEPRAAPEAGAGMSGLWSNPVLSDSAALFCLEGITLQSQKDIGITNHYLKHKTDSWFKVNPGSVSKGRV